MVTLRKVKSNRKFNGKNYKRWGRHYNKKDAQSHAELVRRRGGKARIVKGKNRYNPRGYYDIWVRGGETRGRR